MPLVQSIQYIWVTCASIVAIIATYQLATHSLSIWSEEALQGFDSTQWPIKFGPPASSALATFGENDLQNGTAVAVPTLNTLNINAIFGENDLQDETAVAFTTTTTLNLNTSRGGNDLQDGTLVAIPASTTWNPGATDIAAESGTSDAVADSAYDFSADDGPEQILQEDSNALWYWFNKLKTAVNRTFFHFLSIVIFLLPPICLQLRNSWYDIELYGRIEKTLRPPIPEAKMERPSMGVIADLEEPATQNCQSNQVGFDMSTISKYLHARDQIIRHVQRKQTAKAEQRHKKALEAKKALKRNYQETGKAVMTRLKQLEEELATLKQTAIDFTTPAPVAATPSLSSTVLAVTPLPSCTTKSNTVLPSPTSIQEVPALTTPMPTQPNAFPPLQHSSSLPGHNATSIASASDPRDPSPWLPPSTSQEVSTQQTFSPTQLGPSSALQESPKLPGAFPSQQLPTSLARPEMQSPPASCKFGNTEAVGELKPRSREASKDSKEARTLVGMSSASTVSIPSSISRPEQGSSPPQHLISKSPATKEAVLPPKPVLGPPVLISGQVKAHSFPKGDSQRPRAQPAIPKILKPGKPELPAFLIQDSSRRNKPKLPTFLMQDLAQQKDQGPGPQPTTPSRLYGMVYDTNIPAKKTVCEADKMCQSRVCGKAHHGPRVNPRRPFTIDAYCIYDQKCQSKNCARWHGSPASADGPFRK